ncbi:hypothetical protein B5807_02966 [Epicoccum nigrum]|uniref:Uncharacterized protein n=1 Tax=Epicoccum nigrum TaxID=105696 RepID=A0A1Y2MB53_EPING|nr:hypothetical protein B5807_02966 [Epicoccum nigrum]
MPRHSQQHAKNDRQCWQRNLRWNDDGGGAGVFSPSPTRDDWAPAKQPRAYWSSNLLPILVLTIRLHAWSTAQIISKETV